jgi:hypothetical protein
MLAATVIFGTLNLLLLMYVFRRGEAGTLTWGLALLLSILLGGSIGLHMRGPEPHASPESVALLAPGGVAPAEVEQPGSEVLQPGADAPTQPATRPAPEQASPAEPTARAAPPAAQGTEGGADDTTQAEATEAAAEPEVPQQPAEPEAPPPPPHAAELQVIAGEIAEAANAGAWKRMRERYDAGLALDPKSEVLKSAWEGAQAVRDQRVAAYRNQAFAVFKDRERCTDPKELVRVWATRQTARRGEPQYARLKGAANWLEHCRGKIMESRLRKLIHEGIARRQAFVEPLRQRLHDQGQPVKVSLEGQRDATLRITGGTFDADSAAVLLDGGLRQELAKLGFVKVTFARYTKRHRFSIEAERAADLLQRDLKAMGLAKPFEVEAPQ